MKRTKEALLAQHQSKQAKEGSVLESTRFFSFVRFPPAADQRKFFVFLALAAVFIALPFFLPDSVGRDFFHRRAVDGVRRFQLADNGQFKRTPRAGDSRPNEASTFYALSVLSENPGVVAIQNEAFDTEAIKQLEAKDFDKNAEKIYRGIVQLKALGLLKGALAERYAEKYYNLLLSLAERRSAFRLDLSRSASVSATYYALQAIKELGKLEQFKKRDEFKAAVSFVVSAKDAATGGFRDVLAGENATLVATWQAVQVLAEAEQTEEVKKAYEGVVGFVFSTQPKDGGFLNTPVSSNEELFFSHSKLAHTAQGLYVLETLRKLGQYSPSLRDPALFEAQSYLRACLSPTQGVLGQYPSDEPDLEATYHFLRLVNTYPNVQYGVPRYAQLGSVGLGVVFFLFALLSFYSSQIAPSTVESLKSEAWTTLAYLAVGVAVLQCCTAWALFVYLAFSFYLALQFYAAQAHDASGEGFMILTAAANTFAFMGFVFALLWASPFAFANVSVYYGLLAWGGVVSLLVTFGAIYLTGIKKVHFMASAGYLAWVMNTVLLYAYLYGRGEFAVAYRLLYIGGHLPLVFVVLPVAALLLSYAVSSAATVLYFGGHVGVSGDKEKKEKKVKKEKKNKSETSEDHHSD